MTLPALAVKSSGWGGRGYKNPVTGDGRIVPSITTVLKAESKPALIQWAVDQTAGFAVANSQKLMTMSDASAFKFLRYLPKQNRGIVPGMDLHSYHSGVLEDAADMGTWMHEYVQAEVVPGLEYPDLDAAHDSHWEMVKVWNKFKSEHDIRPHATERTVWNEELGYAGTLDGLWEFDGKICLMDIKTSRGLYTSTWMQLAALLNAPQMFVPQEDDTYAAITDWQLPVEEIGVLHIRPNDVASNGKPMEAFCRWVPAHDLDQHFRAFKGLLAYGEAQREVRLAEKDRGKQ